MFFFSIYTYVGVPAVPSYGRHLHDTEDLLSTPRCSKKTARTINEKGLRSSMHHFFLLLSSLLRITNPFSASVFFSVDDGLLK